jgi:acetolactate synthase I/II/III large subunit
MLANAHSPLILAQRGDPAGRLSAALDIFAAQFGIPVVEPFSVRNVLPSEHPMFIGHNVNAAIAGADAILVLDAAVPWVQALEAPRPETALIHIGPDPHFRRMPSRGFRADIAMTGEPSAALEALAAAMPRPSAAAAARFEAVDNRAEARRAIRRRLAEAQTKTTRPEWLSACVSDILGDDGVAFSENGVLPAYMTLAGPNRLFCTPHSAGLGWCLPAALGAQLADRSRLVVACVGDGSYVFANPVACHQVAEAHALPILTVIANNGGWSSIREAVARVYPEGRAVKADEMPLISPGPSPDFCQIAAASRAHVERVEDGRELPGALRRAVDIIRTERRQVLLDVLVVTPTM